MSRTQQAIQWLNAAPPGETRTQQQAAKLHGISQAAISAALCRIQGRSDKVQAERARCAAVAMKHGAQTVAEEILRGGA